MIEQLGNVMNLNPAHPTGRYKFFLPCRQAQGSGASILDLSGNAAHAVFGAGVVDLTGWARNGYFSPQAAANGMAIVPIGSSSFEISTQSVIFHARINKAAPIASEAFAGNAALGSANQGMYLSLRAQAGGGISKVRPIFRTSNGDFSSIADSSALVADRQLVLSAAPAAGATSVALASNFAGTTGTYLMKFDNGDIRALGLTNGSTVVTGVAAGVTALGAACATTAIVDANQDYHDIGVAVDLVSASKFVKVYVDGVLSDTHVTNLPTGTTTAATGFAIGAQSGVTGTSAVAVPIAGVHLLAWTGTMPPNIDLIMARLAGNPFQYLTDRDFW